LGAALGRPRPRRPLPRPVAQRRGPETLPPGLREGAPLEPVGPAGGNPARVSGRVLGLAHCPPSSSLLAFWVSADGPPARAGLAPGPRAPGGRPRPALEVR